VNGTILWAGESVADIGAPLLTALSILAVAAVASAAASTTTLLEMSSQCQYRSSRQGR
jgi:hypothetical protein